MRFEPLSRSGWIVALAAGRVNGRSTLTWREGRHANRNLRGERPHRRFPVESCGSAAAQDIWQVDSIGQAGLHRRRRRVSGGRRVCTSKSRRVGWSVRWSGRMHLGWCGRVSWSRCSRQRRRVSIRWRRCGCMRLCRCRRVRRCWRMRRRRCVCLRRCVSWRISRCICRRRSRSVGQRRRVCLGRSWCISWCVRRSWRISRYVCRRRSRSVGQRRRVCLGRSRCVCWRRRIRRRRSVVYLKIGRVRAAAFLAVKLLQVVVGIRRAFQNQSVVGGGAADPTLNRCGDIPGHPTEAVCEALAGEHGGDVVAAARRPGSAGQAVVPGGLRLSPIRRHLMSIDGHCRGPGRGIEVHVKRGRRHSRSAWNACHIKRQQGALPNRAATFHVDRGGGSIVRGLRRSVDIRVCRCREIDQRLGHHAKREYRRQNHYDDWHENQPFEMAMRYHRMSLRRVARHGAARMS